MSMHPAAGLCKDTLVNGLLHHWGKSAISIVPPEMGQTIDGVEAAAAEAADVYSDDDEVDCELTRKTSELSVESEEHVVASVGRNTYELRNGIIRPGARQPSLAPFPCSLPPLTAASLTLPLSHCLSHTVALSVSVYTHTLITTLHYPCCYDEIKGIQDFKTCPSPVPSLTAALSHTSRICL